MKILNLYACLGGNRFKWDEVTDVDVTAVELDPDLAKLYQERFPNDKVIVADAHQYLLDHYKEFDFIWSSPPCPSHSKARFWSSKGGRYKPLYPDFKLYEEIIFLKNFFNGKWVVENVEPYYDSLIKPTQIIGKHYLWTNFKINKIDEPPSLHMSKFKDIAKKHKIDLSNYKGKQRKDKICRNLVYFETGRHILETALGIIKKQNVKQKSIFDEC